MAALGRSREASHAGSWYDSNGSVLSSKLQAWLKNATDSHSPARAIIAPHAGYSYSGECAAFAYRQIKPEGIKRIFILGPSHHYYLKTCALSSLEVYTTPLYDLRIDQEIYRELRAAGRFDTMTKDVDEAEHSIEMHLPYVAQVMESCRDQFTIVPILVGSLSPASEKQYGALLARYLADKENLFIISSDFCHWGKRFQYTRYDESKGRIHQSIEHMDREGMAIIERIDPREFTAYLKTTENTICGRHPIGVLLNTIEALKENNPKAGPVVKFTQYAQSGSVTSKNDSSVSYASASLILPVE